jgi:hypothetical protein
MVVPAASPGRRRPIRTSLPSPKPSQVLEWTPLLRPARQERRGGSGRACSRHKGSVAPPEPELHPIQRTCLAEHGASCCVRAISTSRSGAMLCRKGRATAGPQACPISCRSPRSPRNSAYRGNRYHPLGPILGLLVDDTLGGVVQQVALFVFGLFAEPLLTFHRALPIATALTCLHKGGLESGDRLAPSSSYFLPCSSACAFAASSACPLA